MKKIILSLVFLLATGTMMNATTDIQRNDQCWEMGETAVEMAQYYANRPNYFGWPGESLSFEEEYDVFAEAYEECLGN